MNNPDLGSPLDKPPRLRVARIDKTEEDSRKWEIDSETEHRLNDAHALRYYESINTAALRVRQPEVNLSYGILWEVANAPDRLEDSSVAELRSRWMGSLLSESHRTQLVRTLAEAICVAREVLMDNKWKEPVTCSFMFFDGESKLRLLAAARGENKVASEVQSDSSLRYGEGIAGRALKANRIKVYVAPGAEVSDGPDYYAHLTEGVQHKVLMSFPVHVPENVKAPENPAVYQGKRPFGVLSLGSDHHNCPLAGFRLPERMPYAVAFQHDLNRLLFRSLMDVFLGGNST